MKRLALFWTALVCTPLCLAADFTGAAPSAQGRQLVLYVQKSFGEHTTASTWGLRLDAMSALPGMTEAASATLHRRRLVDFAMAPLDHARVDFGNRVRWDLHAGTFGSPHLD